MAAGWWHLHGSRRAQRGLIARGLALVEARPSGRARGAARRPREPRTRRARRHAGAGARVDMRQLVSRRAERAGAAPGCMCGRRVVVTGSCVRLRGGGGWLAGAARACGARGVSTARGALAPAAVCGRLLGRAPRAALLVRRVVQAQLLRRGARLAGGGVEAPHLGAALCSRSACLPARTARRRGWQSATSPRRSFIKYTILVITYIL